MMIVSIRDFSVQGATDYSVLDESNQDGAWSAVMTVAPGEFLSGVGDLVDIGSMIEMKRKLRADEAAFKAIAAADPIIRADDGSTYHLISDAGAGVYSLGLHFAFKEAWGGETEAEERFQDEIGYVRNSALDMIELGMSVAESTRELTKYLKAREKAVNVKDDPDACQFAADSLDGFSTSDC